MRNGKQSWSRRLGLGMAAAGLCLAALVFGTVKAQENVSAQQKIDVHVYSKKLTSADKLSDMDKVIEIKGETTLIWVDLMPNARFSHPTEYILISAAGTRIVKGEWWPTLNGKALFRGEPVTRCSRSPKI